MQRRMRTRKLINYSFQIYLYSELESIVCWLRFKMSLKVQGQQEKFEIFTVLQGNLVLNPMP